MRYHCRSLRWRHCRGGVVHIPLSKFTQQIASFCLHQGGSFWCRQACATYLVLTPIYRHVDGERIAQPTSIRSSVLFCEVPAAWLNIPLPMPTTGAVGSKRTSPPPPSASFPAASIGPALSVLLALCVFSIMLFYSF